MEIILPVIGTIWSGIGYIIWRYTLGSRIVEMWSSIYKQIKEFGLKQVNWKHVTPQLAIPVGMTVLWIIMLAFCLVFGPLSYAIVQTPNLRSEE